MGSGLKMSSSLEDVIERGNLEEVQAHLSRLSTEELEGLLANHTTKGLPTLHYLARFPFSDKDKDALEKVISTFIKFGYNINERSDNYRARKRASLGFTALFAAIEQRNVLLVECLLEHGATTDIRDQRGFTPCHWAIMVGNFKSFNRLIEAGAPLTSTEEERSGIASDVHPLLHTAVDEGRMEMVYRLVNKGLVDVNERAIYRRVLSEGAFTQFPSRYNSDPESLETIDISFTALGRAVRMRKISIIEYLLSINEIELSGFEELHFCIVEGDSEVACLLQDYFSDEELSNDKIGDKWALHCLHPKAFLDETRVEKTKELIYAYLDAGWDINSTSESVIHEMCPAFWPEGGKIELMYEHSFQGWTLLHLACFCKSFEIVKCLVDERADINCKTGGDNRLVPLQVLLLSQEMKIAVYLIEKGADIGLEGTLLQLFGPYANTHARFTSVELLLRLGYVEGTHVLDLMLLNWNWHGAQEFHAAVAGGNPTFVLKVLNYFSMNQHFISKEDLAFIKIAESGGRVVPIPSLVWTLAMFYWKWRMYEESGGVAALIELINLMVSLGYDGNLKYNNAQPVFDRFPDEFKECLIFVILKIDFATRSENRLLRALLKCDHVQLNVKNIEGLNPVESMIAQWNELCMGNGNLEATNVEQCWKVKDGRPRCYETVKILISHGVDVSEIKIDDKFPYHFGYKPMIQLLYYAGAKINSSFFAKPPICHVGYYGTRPFSGEIEELENWKEEFDEQHYMSLVYKCSLRIRKMLKTIGQVKVLEQELPQEMKDAVLGLVSI